MLDIFNNIKPFFEDTYRETSVREYGRLIKISPPTASKILKDLEKEGLLISRKQGIYFFFKANRENSLFNDLGVAFWRMTLKKLFEPFHEKILFKEVILFGSIIKSENTAESDIDLFLDINFKELELKEIENKLGRKIQLHFKDSLKNQNLKNNIEKGVRIL